MKSQNFNGAGLLLSVILAGTFLVPLRLAAAADSGPLDQTLLDHLHQLGFTGNIEARLEQRLGRPLNPARANVGRLLWFDTITGLHNDNTCAGCHSPTDGFGDTQSIAIGIDNNGIVGPARSGPRNQRRTPMVINTAFYPNLMWNSRFASLADDPFDNRAGFQFQLRYPRRSIEATQRHWGLPDAFRPGFPGSAAGRAHYFRDVWQGHRRI